MDPTDEEFTRRCIKPVPCEMWCLTSKCLERTVAVDRHPMSARFHAILTELGDLHDQKQADYGRDDDPFANVRGADEWNVPPWVGAMIRATDKVRRLQTLQRRGSLTNESAIDAFNDLAVYAVIGRILFEQEGSA